MTLKQKIGRKIRLIRAGKKLTQAEFALNVEVSPATVSGWEIGDIGISIEAAIRVARFSAVSLDWLLMDAQDIVTVSPGAELTPEEARLLEAFQSYDRSGQLALLRIIEVGKGDRG